MGHEGRATGYFVWGKKSKSAGLGWKIRTPTPEPGNAKSRAEAKASLAIPINQQQDLSQSWKQSVLEEVLKKQWYSTLKHLLCSGHYHKHLTDWNTEFSNNTVVISILQIKKLKPRGVKRLAPVQTASKKQSQNLRAVWLVSESHLFTRVPQLLVLEGTGGRQRVSNPFH